MIPVQEASRPATADQYVVAKVRLLPKPGLAGLLAGARITGSNEGPTTAFVELARIDRDPAGDGWFELTMRPGKVYRFVKIESARGAGLALAEIEFYSLTGRLSGSGFGTTWPITSTSRRSGTEKLGPAAGSPFAFAPAGRRWCG